ncbi:hypothetical protein DID76_04695, partial [Candidatus Marinamargulisbacteria bacterium SCGC AG-414-C22]
MNKQSVLTCLNTVIENEQFVNGYIFYGPSYDMLKAASFYFVETCFKSKSTFDLNNDSLANTPDLCVLTPEGASLKIEDIRHVQERVKYGPTIQNRLFVIVEKADMLTTQAANAFLKTLEEPLDNVTFILLTTHVKQLIPTIVSRCQSLYISQHEQVPAHLTLLGAQIEQIKGVSYADFSSQSMGEKFSFLENMAKDKAQAKQQLECWIKEAYEQQQ